MCVYSLIPQGPNNVSLHVAAAALPRAAPPPVTRGRRAGPKEKPPSNYARDAFRMTRMRMRTLPALPLAHLLANRSQGAHQPLLKPHPLPQATKKVSLPVNHQTPAAPNLLPVPLLFPNTTFSLLPSESQPTYPRLPSPTSMTFPMVESCRRSAQIPSPPLSASCRKAKT